MRLAYRMRQDKLTKLGTVELSQIDGRFSARPRIQNGLRRVFGIREWRLLPARVNTAELSELQFRAAGDRRTKHQAAELRQCAAAVLCDAIKAPVRKPKIAFRNVNTAPREKQVSTDYVRSFRRTGRATRSNSCNETRSD